MYRRGIHQTDQNDNELSADSEIGMRYFSVTNFIKIRNELLEKRLIIGKICLNFTELRIAFGRV